MTMQYVTCNRRGYKILNPVIWQVFDGRKFLGYSHGMGTEFCDPPVYYIDPKQQHQEPLSNLPEGATIEKEPVIVEPVEVIKYETDPEVLKELEIYRSYELKERWQLEYDWHYGHELYWDYKSKKAAEEHMEQIKDFFGKSLSETIKNIKVTKYVIGKGGVKPPPFTI